MVRQFPFASMGRVRFPLLLILLLAVPHLNSAARGAEDREGPPQSGLQGIRSYISSGWDALTRSMTQCESVQGGWLKMDPPVLYLPAGLPLPMAVEELQKNCTVHVGHLPAEIRRPGETDLGGLESRALLYLPNPYVVPGGQFNEMYGWDSYFILRGLLRDGRTELARGMVENFFFEIEHYGMILNANRAYFLKRSQPPFLTSMIRAVYEADQTVSRADRAWLEKAYSYAERDYRMWIRAPHLAGETGLSRYYGLGEGVSPDLVANRSATRDFAYVTSYFLRNREEAANYLARGPDRESLASLYGPVYSVYLCNPEAEPSAEECRYVESVGLSADFYKGDESMRESGFDISYMFGPFSGSTHHFAPVGLNSLLYRTEQDLAWMSGELGRDSETESWLERARGRRHKMQEHLWDDRRGLFFNFDFQKRARSSYEYMTTFYPLWVGLASPEQARRVVRNLELFEHAGGLAMSRRETKTQWDFPYGWAPAHLIAVEGLRRYGFDEEANRISLKFLSMVMENFRRDGTIREKYNVVTRTTDTRVEAGYQVNVIGFGWTNGVFLELLRQLPDEWLDRLEQMQ